MTKKRGHGEGSVFERKDRPGTWRASFTFTNPATGETERKTFDRGSRREALAVGRKWQDQREKGLLPEGDKITLGDWIDTWLKQYIKPNVRIKSYDKYEGCLVQYVKPTLGNTLLRQVRETHLTTLFNELLASGGKKGQGLSSSTVKATRRYLSMCLEQAIKSDMLLKNPVKQTKPIKLVKVEIKTLTESHSAELIAAAQALAIEADQAYAIKAAKAAEKAAKTGECIQVQVPMSNIVYHSAYMAILLALNTGMRLGEIFGLSWDSVDVKKGIVYVKRALVTSISGVRFEEPKTKSSKRQIPLSADVAAELRKYKTRQEWYKNLLGDKWSPLNLVITGEWGQVFNTSNFTSRYFKPLIKEIGAGDSFKFHDLRHTHATLLLLKGIPVKVVSERLGHSTVSMTQDTYAHVLPEMQAEVVKVLEGVFTRKINA